MISIEALRGELDGDWVAIDRHGQVVDYEVPKDIGPATLSVSPMTEALKRVDQDDRVVGDLDRDTVWTVDALVLNTVVLRRLPEREYTAEELIDAVREAGFAWQISYFRPLSAQ